MIKKLTWWSRKISAFVYVPVQAEVDKYKFIRPGRNIEFVLECMWVHVKRSVLKCWTWGLWNMTPELSTGRQAWKIFKRLIKRSKHPGKLGKQQCVAMLADIIAMRINGEPQKMFDGVLLASRVANTVTVAPVTMTKEQNRDQYKMKLLPLLYRCHLASWGQNILNTSSHKRSHRRCWQYWCCHCPNDTRRILNASIAAINNFHRPFLRSITAPC